jgi:putative selenate reductase
MAELVPLPFGRLVSRMFKELEKDGAIFDLGRAMFFTGDPARDLSVPFHGHRAATPLGPAAGPHSQLAQNIVLSFLGGGRVFELKTVQIDDKLVIPRPCIDMATVGYNVEWSQELLLEQSLEEYVKASMLIEMLVASGKLGLASGAERTVFDMSVGYDLAGIKSERVRAFIDGMKDCKAVVDRLRGEIPAEHAKLRDLAFTTKLSDTLTLSTFHGCPPDEIERIVDHLLREHALDCIVKLNPTLLGPIEARRVMHDVLGYADRTPDEAFEKDTRWEQAVDFVGRLGDTAKSLGRGFGVKFSNTLIVENTRSFFPKEEKVMYLSGPPLHVLAIQLVAKFRGTFGDRWPISFSAGIDRHNFADAVSLGLVPVTVCSDLLQTGGYARMRHYFADLGKRMAACGARDIDEWVLRGRGQAEAALAAVASGTEADACRAAFASGGDLRAAAGPELFARWLGEARVRNARAYADEVLADPRYAAAANAKPPTKVGTKLWLFECLTCDKCVPVCPNDANFTFTLPKEDIPVVKLRPRTGGGFDREDGAPLVIKKKHQIGNYADFCNECGNCDVFCPEDGGPYILKPRFFGTEESFRRFAKHDGFFVARTHRSLALGAAGAHVDTVLGRFEGRTFRLVLEGARASFAGDGFDVHLDVGDPENTVEGRAEPTAVVDLTYFRIMNALRRATLDGPEVTYVNA